MSTGAASVLAVALVLFLASGPSSSALGVAETNEVPLHHQSLAEVRMFLYVCLLVCVLCCDKGVPCPTKYQSRQQLTKP